MALSDQNLTAQEQAQFDAMRASEDTPAPEMAPEDAAETAAPPPVSDADAAPLPQRSQMVPLAALHEERERRKSLDRELVAERERLRLLEERTNLMLQRFGQGSEAQQPTERPLAPSPAIPDLAADPVGHIVGQQQAFAQRLDEFGATAQQQRNEWQRQQQTTQAITGLVQRAQAAEQAFMADQPDYGDAVRFLMNKRNAELELLIPDQLQRHTLIQQEGLQLAAIALQNGKSPPAIVYDLAKLRGYAAPTADGGTPSQNAGQQRIQQIANGQQQERSLSVARGGSPPPLTAQRLAEMSNAEFDKMIKTPAGKALLGA